MDDTILEIRFEPRDACDVITLAGELDCHTAPELAQALERVSHNGRRVVVDLSRLRFIDSSGLHILMSGAGSADARRIVVCPPGNVARVLSIVRAEAMLTLYDDLDGALDGARRGDGDGPGP